MRVLGALVVGLIMYIGVPLLWQHLMVAKVVEMEKGPPPIPVSAPIATVDSNLMLNGITPVNIDTAEYEKIAVQSQADQAMRQAQQAQDQAWAASHPNIP